MPAPQGNSFWENRSKHGRDRLFAAPSDMWEAACEFFKWCEKNPLIEIDFAGKDATEVKKPKMRAFTLHGLCRYLHCNTKYFNDFKDGLKGKDDEVSKGFSEVITLIYDTLYEQKFTGAAAGFLNANLISRELGLADKSTLQGDKDNPINVDHKFKITLNLNK